MTYYISRLIYELNLILDVHILDLNSETWEMIDTAGMQEVPTHRHSHAAVVYGQSMYIFGGKNLKKFNDLYL